MFKNLDVRVRAFLLLSLILWSFLFNDPRFDGGILLITFSLALGAQIKWGQIRRTLPPLLPLFLMILLFASLNMGNQHFQQELSRRTVFGVWPTHHWNITYGGFFQGLTFLLRMLILMITSIIFQQTTPLEEFTQLLQKLNAPSQLSFMLVTALRFIPVLNRKRILILEAQKARGAQISEKVSGISFKNYLPLIIPLFASSIQMANTLSMAMLSRGYGATPYRTAAKEIKFQVRDGLVLGSLLVFLALGVYLRMELGMGRL